LLAHGRRFTVTFLGYGERTAQPPDPDGLGIVEAPAARQQAADRRVRGERMFAVSGSTAMYTVGIGAHAGVQSNCPEVGPCYVAGYVGW
jgi:hypothetical protein